jgi:hypothetical protein
LHDFARCTPCGRCFKWIREDDISDIQILINALLAMHADPAAAAPRTLKLPQDGRDRDVGILYSQVGSGPPDAHSEPRRERILTEFSMSCDVTRISGTWVAFTSSEQILVTWQAADRDIFGKSGNLIKGRLR